LRDKKTNAGASALYAQTMVVSILNLFFMQILSAKSALVVIVLLVVGASMLAFRSAAGSAQYMTITTVESIIPAGLGRSRLMVTYPDGKQEITEMENLYSAVGIRFENIQVNDRSVTAMLNNLAAQGWEVENVATGVQSPSQGASQGIYMTRYLLVKEQ
jgi:hypothetical protein